MTYQWNTPIRYVRGLGPTRSRELIKMGITTVGELLERHPLSYIYPGIIPISDAKEGNAVIKAKIKEIGRLYGKTTRATLYDDAGGVCRAMWYYGAWALHTLRPGMTVIFYGKMKGGVLSQPKWCTHEGGMENVYGGQYGTHHSTIRTALKEVLANVELPEMYNGLSRVGVFRAFHFPQHKAKQQKAEADLKFDEALTLQLALAEKRRGRESVRGEVIWI